MTSRVKFSEIAELVMGQSPKGSDCNDSGDGFPLLNGPTEFTERSPLPVQFTTVGKKFSKVGDILFCVRGSTTGRMNYADQTYAIGRGIGAIRGINGYPTAYVRAVLERNLDRLLVAATGSTFPNVGKDLLNNFEVDVCSPEQAQNVNILLVAIEDKRYLNTQTNQTLEEMAQAIFRSWFVDFDPVKAKMNGEQPEGMDAATASLFPEKIDSETGIPAGWSQGVIANIAKLNSKSWTKKNQPKQVHYVDLANTKNGVIETITTYDFDEAPSRARRVLNYGDSIVGTVRPGNRSFAFIGETEQPLTGSTGFAVLSPQEEFWASFVYLATTNDDSIDEYARLADGGAYPAIKPVVVADTPCVIPTTDIAQKFWQLTGVMLKKAHQNRLENEELAKLRDTLLPKLLSGEIELEGAGVVEENDVVNRLLKQMDFGVKFRPRQESIPEGSFGYISLSGTFGFDGGTFVSIPKAVQALTKITSADGIYSEIVGNALTENILSGTVELATNNIIPLGVLTKICTAVFGKKTPIKPRNAVLLTSIHQAKNKTLDGIMNEQAKRFKFLEQSSMDEQEFGESLRYLESIGVVKCEGQHIALLDTIVQH